MKTKIASWFVAAGVMVMLPLYANAAIVTYSFNLDGSQETPPSGSPAAGSAQFTIDDGTDTVTFALLALNLQGSPAAAHIHFGKVGVAGSVVFDILANADATGPVTIGPISIPNSFAAAGTDKSLDTGLGALINAAPWDYYVNLHSDLFPGGEIRGQLEVAAVPIPAAVWLFGSALGAVGFLRRRLT